MPKPFFILAPMDDVTDTVFRRIVSDCAHSLTTQLDAAQGGGEGRSEAYKKYVETSTGASNAVKRQKYQQAISLTDGQDGTVRWQGPDYTMTEFVNVDGLKSAGRSKLIRKLGVEKDTTPVIAQIWGRTPEKFEMIAKEISDGDIPGFYGIDINFGCPAKSEVRAGCCSALQQIELRPNAEAMIRATINGAKAGKNNLPVSFKTRLGFDHIDYTWHEFLLGFKPWILTVHVRTTKQMSKVPAQWEAIEPIVALRDKLSPETKIVLNGDVMNRKQGRRIAEKHGVDGIMIGRGIFHDPYCFAEESPWENKSREERIELFKTHVLLHDEVFPDGQRPFSPLKKFAKVYINSFPGASELRDQIMHTESVAEALSVLADAN
jgi:tRNA-dihydrouridine synthase